MSTPSKRREKDIMKLINSDHKVEMINDEIKLFYVYFHGPKDSLYQRGVWKIRVQLPPDYPFRHPFIGFMNKIYHPNIDESSGAVCLDVITHKWNPMFDLVNIFELFLPQLLLFPNENDPLNIEAGTLVTHNKGLYELRVKDYCEKYAKPEDVGIVLEKKSSDEENSEDKNNSNADDNPN